MLGYAHAMAGLRPQRAESFEVAEEIQPGELYRYGGMSWSAMLRPDMTWAFAFYREKERLLISGVGVRFRSRINGFGRESSRRSRHAGNAFHIERGHGHSRARETVHQRTCSAGAQLQASGRIRGRYLAYGRDRSQGDADLHLLERGSLPLASLSGYLDTVPRIPRIQGNVFRLTLQALADLLVTSLSTGVVGQVKDCWSRVELNNLGRLFVAGQLKQPKIQQYVL